MAPHLSGMRNWTDFAESTPHKLGEDKHPKFLGKAMELFTSIRINSENLLTCSLIFATIYNVAE